MGKEKINEGRARSLEATLAQIEKTMGKGAVMRMGDRGMNVQAFSTGCLPLDLALGVGGVPKGRIVELFGVESGGKTSLALHIAAAVQREGGTAAVIDAEHAMDPEYAERIGVDTGALLIAQPDTGEDALEICDALVRSGAVDLIIVDSVAALVPKAEIEGDMGQNFVGLQARLMSQALRKLGGNVSKANCTVVFINQLREKVGVMFGNPEVTPGGRALKFWASVRIEVRKGETLKDGSGQAIGNRTKVKIVKNKVAPPFRTCEFDMYYGTGICRAGAILDVAVERGLVAKNGAFYSYDGAKIGQGRDNARQALVANAELLDGLEAKLRGGAAEEGTTDAGNTD